MNIESRPLTATTRWLHGLVAIGVMTMLAYGFVMEELDFDGAVLLHISFGLTLLFFIAYRTLRRLIIGWPEPNTQHSEATRRIARLVQWVLLLASLLMPLSGLLMATMSGWGLQWFGVELMAWSPNPAVPGEVIAVSEFWQEVGHEVHEYTAFVLLAGIVLHVAGALKHHFVDRDKTLRSIWRG